LSGEPQRQLDLINRLNDHFRQLASNPEDIKIISNMKDEDTPSSINLKGYFWGESRLKDYFGGQNEVNYLIIVEMLRQNPMNKPSE